jgi:hypothetical protein
MKVKVKSRFELEQEARNIFSDLDEGYAPCEALYIIGQVVQMMSIAMLQRDGGA